MVSKVGVKVGVTTSGKIPSSTVVGEGLDEGIIVMSGEGSGVNVGMIFGTMVCSKEGEGVGDTEDEAIVLKILVPSNPFRLAIANQSNLPSPWPLTDFITNPYGVFSDTYNWPCILVVGVTNTFSGTSGDMTEVNEKSK